MSAPITWSAILSRTHWSIRRLLPTQGAWYCGTCSAFRLMADQFGSPATTFCPACNQPGPWVPYTPEITKPKEFINQL
jgi:hypothetical protein